MIVTNAMPGWVEACASFFVPEVEPTLASVHVVYARTAHQNRRPALRPARDVAAVGCVEELTELMTSWKLAAFEDSARKFYRRKLWRNILSIGDAAYEADALQELAFRRDDNLLQVKIEKCPGKRSVNDLTQGLLERSTLYAKAFVFKPKY